MAYEKIQSVIKDRCNLEEVKILQPDIFSDFRGTTSIPYETLAYASHDIDFQIRQINQGYTIKANTIRGLHFQREPHAQAKLVSCLQGSVYSVAVDIRENSPAFGQYIGTTLSFENQRVMYIPRGFAHGYLTLEDHVLIQWCVDNEFRASSARSLRFDDVDIMSANNTHGIQWPFKKGEVIISDKDKSAQSLLQIIAMRN